MLFLSTVLCGLRDILWDLKPQEPGVKRDLWRLVLGVTDRTYHKLVRQLQETKGEKDWGVCFKSDSSFRIINRAKSLE